MKKYTKPYLLVESFQLDTAIASCTSDGGMALGKYLSNCVLTEGEFAGLNIFAEGCEKEGLVNVTNPNDPNDTVCYQGPLGTTTFLAS